MSYRDNNGKTGYKMMVGASGKTYGDLRLLSHLERAMALDDGIDVWTKPAPAGPTPEQVKARAAQAIVNEAEAAVNNIMTVDERISALAEALDLLEAKVNGVVLTEAEIAQEASLRADRLAIDQIRGKAKQDVIDLGP